MGVKVRVGGRLHLGHLRSLIGPPPAPLPQGAAEVRGGPGGSCQRPPPAGQGHWAGCWSSEARLSPSSLQAMPGASSRAPGGRLSGRPPGNLSPGGVVPGGGGAQRAQSAGGLASLARAHGPDRLARGLRAAWGGHLLPSSWEEELPRCGLGWEGCRGSRESRGVLGQDGQPARSAVYPRWSQGPPSPRQTGVRAPRRVRWDGVGRGVWALWEPPGRCWGEVSGRPPRRLWPH